MVNSNAGKGSQYRPVNKEKYDRGYLRVFGKICPLCKGTGILEKDNIAFVFTCPKCNGIGYIEKEK